MHQNRPNPSYIWYEVSHGRWERDLDEAEIFYSSLQKQFESTGRKFFAITGHVIINIPGELANTITHDELDKALKYSWLKLRQSHPSIAVETVFDSERGRLKKTYQTAIDSQHEEWLKQTFHIVRTEQSSEQWCNSDPPAPDTASLFAIGPATPNTGLRRALVLRSPHNVMDGIGTLQLLGIYLHHLAEILTSRNFGSSLLWTDEHTRLTPPLRIAARLLDETPSNVQIALEGAQNRGAALLSQGPPVMAVPCSSDIKLPAAHQRVALCLDQATTLAIIQACKSASVSVTHAYHAAASVVLAQRQPRGVQARSMQYVSYALVDLRAQCQPPYNGSAHAASIYHCTSAEKFGVKFTIPDKQDTTCDLSTEFARVLEEIKTYYVANRPSTEPMLLQIAPLLWHVATPHIPEATWTQPGSMPVPPPNPSPSISMSSFGVVDRFIPAQLGDISVHDPWVTGEELGPGIGLFLGTFRGRLELSAAFNSAWHNTHEIQDYLDEIHKIVYTCLNLSPHGASASP